MKDNKRFTLKLLAESEGEFIEAFENMVHSRKQTRSFRKYPGTGIEIKENSLDTPEDLASLSRAKSQHDRVKETHSALLQNRQGPG